MIRDRPSSPPAAGPRWNGAVWGRLPAWRLCVVISALAACAARSPDDPAGPVTLDDPPSAIPPPGLCRVTARPLPQGCDGILHAAPLGSRVFFRPADGSRDVYVCYMSTSDPGVVIGIDVFHVDTRRLIRVHHDFDERRCG